MIGQLEDSNEFCQPMPLRLGAGEVLIEVEGMGIKGKTEGKD